MTDLVVMNAALLSAVEIGLGSLLHGFKVPLAGHFLSLNQGFLLCRGLKASQSKSLPLKVSNVAAVLKSLSPAGKRLTPMLAISAQGLCFSFGPWLCGINLIGMIFGTVLLSFWAFLQPLLIAYVLFGETLLRAVVFLLQSVQKSWGIEVKSQLTLAACLVALKIVFAIGVAVAAYFLPDTVVKRYQDKMLSVGRQRRKTFAMTAPSEGWASQIKPALRDLFSPLFLFSLLLTVLFFLWAESPRATLIWAVLRPVAVGFLLFFLFRVIPLDRVSKTVQSAVAAIREM